MAKLLDMLGEIPDAHHYYASMPIGSSRVETYTVFEAVGRPATYRRISLHEDPQEAKPEFVDEGLFVGVFQGGRA